MPYTPSNEVLTFDHVRTYVRAAPVARAVLRWRARAGTARGAAWRSSPTATASSLRCRCARFRCGGTSRQGADHSAWRPHAQARRWLMDVKNMDGIVVVDVPYLSGLSEGLKQLLPQFDAAIFVDICKEGQQPFASMVCQLQTLRLLPPRWECVAAPRTYNPVRAPGRAAARALTSAAVRCAAGQHRDLHVPGGRNRVGVPPAALARTCRAARCAAADLRPQRKNAPFNSLYSATHTSAMASSSSSCCGGRQHCYVSAPRRQQRGHLCVRVGTATHIVGVLPAHERHHGLAHAGEELVVLRAQRTAGSATAFPSPCRPSAWVPTRCSCAASSVLMRWRSLGSS
jgi:hypothetical protein